MAARLALWVPRPPGPSRRLLPLQHIAYLLLLREEGGAEEQSAEEDVAVGFPRTLWPAIKSPLGGRCVPKTQTGPQQPASR